MRLAEFDFGTAIDAEVLANLREVTHGVGCFRMRHPLFPAGRGSDAIACARAFFQLPEAEKQQLAIERSPHFRGYSVMRNERDWREQLHMGREEESHRSATVYERLRGPNLWPARAGWKQAILTLMDDLEQAARDVLQALAMSLVLPASHFLRESETPYLVMKLIHYQPLPNCEPRLGVAPHVDFSWITLLLQDDTGGLEFRHPDGGWHAIPPVADRLVVNVGEILEFATGGYFASTPHRVINGARSRISLPFFLNPALDSKVERMVVGSGAAESPKPEGGPGSASHVHRVFASARPNGFVYGDEEWRRKGLNVYCEACVPYPPKTSIRA